MSCPIPDHKNSRFWLFRDKYVIVEAILNIVQATASKSYFLTTCISVHIMLFYENNYDAYKMHDYL